MSLFNFLRLEACDLPNVWLNKICRSCLEVGRERKRVTSACTERCANKLLYLELDVMFSELLVRLLFVLFNQNTLTHPSVHAGA